MKPFETFDLGTPEYVFYHGLYEQSQGRSVSAQLSTHYGTGRNPNDDFYFAKSIVKDHSSEERTDTVFDRPFLRSQIDWAVMYEHHLNGPHADVSFSPKEGIDLCKCSLCFYRDSPPGYSPGKDCGVGEDGDLAKKFFGLPSDKFLPEVIDGKQVGHYCPYWLSFAAE